MPCNDPFERSPMRTLTWLVGLTLMWAPPYASVHAQAVSRALGTPMAWQVVEESDTAVVSGVVMSRSLEPLSGVLVLIDTLKLGVLTDERGFFRLPAPPPGEWPLSFSFVGMEPIVERIIVPERTSVRVLAVLARERAICNNACVGTWCEDLGIEVVDVITGSRPQVPIVLRVEFGGRVEQSVIPYDPESRVTYATWAGLGKKIETVGWHSLEISAEGYEPWRKERVWLENVPLCHGYLMGREHRAELVPISRR